MNAGHWRVVWSSWSSRHISQEMHSERKRDDRSRVDNDFSCCLRCVNRKAILVILAAPTVRHEPPLPTDGLSEVLSHHGFRLRCQQKQKAPRDAWHHAGLSQPEIELACHKRTGVNLSSVQNRVKSFCHVRRGWSATQHFPRSWLWGRLSPRKWTFADDPSSRRD